jgi:hypothetical protein
MIIEALLFVAALLLFWAYANKIPPNYPPTPPICLPLIGHMHYLFPYGAQNRNKGLHELFEKYNKNGVMAFHLLFGFKFVFIGEISALSKRVDLIDLKPSYSLRNP